MTLYHYQIFFPEEINLPSGSLLPVYSKHALAEAKTDRYGPIELPEIIHFEKYKVIELELDERDRLIKVLCRGRLDSRRDICLAIMPTTRKVKTIWSNLLEDEHFTLDEKKYRTREDHLVFLESIGKKPNK